MKKIIKLYRKYEEIINYIIVGALTTLISLITYYVCVLTFFEPKNALELQAANLISWIISVIFSYFTNRIFVFKSKSKKKIKEFLSFVTARILTLVLDMLIMFIMVTILEINDKLSKLIVQVIVIALNYIFSKLFIFKKNSI